MSTKNRLVIALLALVGLAIVTLLHQPPVSAAAAIADNGELDATLVEQATVLLISELHLQEGQYQLNILDVQTELTSARIDVELTTTGPMGTITEVVHVFALHDGTTVSAVFREPSPSFYEYAWQVSPTLLPGDRLLFWQTLWEHDQDAGLTVPASAYKLPFTGNTRQYVYQDFDKHFDFTGGGWTARAARGGQAYNQIDPYGAYYTRVTHSDGTYGWYIHFQANSWFHGGQGSTYSVSQGDCLGITGDTGQATGPHLHFNVSTTQDNDPGCDISTGCNPPNWLVVSFTEGSIPSQGYTPYSQNSTASCSGGGCCGCGTQQHSDSPLAQAEVSLTPFGPEPPDEISEPPEESAVPADSPPIAAAPPPLEPPPTEPTPAPLLPDETAPEVHLSIAGRSDAVIPALHAALSIQVSDDRAVTQMRFSADRKFWSDWEPYAPWRTWQFADSDAPQTVFVQVQDAAGNVSSPAMVEVSVSLENGPPTSVSYTLAKSVMGMSGGEKTSSSYIVRGTGGQPYETGHLQSSSYQVFSGFWGGTLTSTGYTVFLPVTLR